MIRKYCFLTILTLLVIPSLPGQEAYMRFRRITINEGLSLSSVYSIYQDSKGFMWFGTEDGLNKYDGQSITVFGAATDQHNILANKWIEQVYEDKSGMIWLGSRGGLTMFNPRKGQFLVLRHDPASAFTLSNDTVSAIISDLRNVVWVGTFRGLNRVDRYTGEAERIVPDENDLLGLMSRISGFALDHAGNLWIGTYQGLFSNDRKSGLFFNETADGTLDYGEKILCMDAGNTTLWLGTEKALVMLDLTGNGKHLKIPLDAGDEDIVIERLLVDRSDRVWMQTSGGLYCYRNEAEGIRRVLEAGGNTHSLALNPVEPLIEDQKGSIWYGTFGDGVYRVDPLTLECNHYLNNPGDPSSLSENSVNCIFEDRNGALWFGTFGAGISILDPWANQFTLYKNNPFDENSLASSFIWTVWEARDSVLWMGTNDRGISCFDPRTGTYTHYDHDPLDPASLSHSSVRKVFQDSRGRIWVGTDGGGLDLFRPENKSFRHFRHDPDDPGTISDNSVRTVYEDRDGRIWVGTRNGLNRFDPESGKFTRYVHNRNDPGSLSNNFVYSALYQDHEGQLWIGTYGGGLCRMDTEEGTCIVYASDPQDPTTLSDNIVFSIYEDDRGRFWIGTNSGLNMFYPATGSFRRFGVDEGLANEVIYGILPDDQGRIWLSTNLGIIRFDLETFAVKNFDMNDGLQSNEFNGGAFHRGRSGKLYFGGVYGLNVIDPSRVEPTRNVTQLTLTRLEVMGREVRVAGIELEEQFEKEPGNIIEYEGEFYSGENVTYLEQIVLDYRHRFFSIEFTGLNNLQSHKLRYSYMMENLDDEWNNAGSRNYVSYTNMPSGSYTLKIRAENADGIRSDPPMQLGILITAPVWQAWWFILMEVLLAAAIIIMIYNYLVKIRTNRLLTYQNQQISQANEALRESEKNLMELNATKDKFFSIISHDLKNPFSSLLSISELMVESFDDTQREDHRAGFRKIHQSVKHLLDLLENLLTWSRSQRGRIKYDPVRFNLSNLIRENVNLHKLLAEKKGIMLLSPEENEYYAYGDRDMINSVIRNLMTNAVKFTPRDRKVEVKVEQKENEVVISIIDEGIGISAEDQEKLFRIDEKFKSVGTEGEKGTGLGLIICREFVEKNGGSINVQSKPGRGSVFSFTIPVTNGDGD
jgi:ligand-binding sensor domain-containing protein/signal transduction histidine kinase